MTGGNCWGANVVVNWGRNAMSVGVVGGQWRVLVWEATALAIVVVTCRVVVYVGVIIVVHADSTAAV